MNGQLNSCHCCEGLTAQTPAPVTNRPGLSVIAYRVGTHSEFKRSMLAALSDITRPALQGLKTRDDDDFSIALLDAAATMADVLTFYQERIATESYLRTATERRSLLELARLIGYELRPGVAASTFLAFTMDDTPGAPLETTVDIGTKVQSVPGPDEKPQTFETVEKITARVEWNSIKPQVRQTFIPQFGDTHIFLKGTGTNLKSGDAILFVGPEREADPGSERWDFRRVTRVSPDFDANRTRIEWEEGLGTTTPHLVLPSANPKVYALRLRASLFGFNAPHPATLSNDTLDHYSISKTPPISDWPFRINNQAIDLDTAYPGILTNSWLILSQPSYQELYRATSVVEASRAEFTLAGKTTRIYLDTSENLPLFESAYRATTVFAQSELLEIAEAPITAPITGATIQLAQPPADLVKGQWLVASGKDSATGEAVIEIIQVAAIDGATLTVTPPLKNSYVRVAPKPEEGFSINANVAHATHGETVSEILGGGDAGQRYQQFILRQPPLTYVRAATPSGAASTLELRVNDLLWHEAPTLFGHDPQEHVYVTRTGDDEKTTVEFGDGVTGARLPTGQDNIRAKYRKGIGVDGLVKASQLSSLLTRPLGIKSVTNPEDATGAQDRESLDDARTNAPLKVLTLDRTVSIQDYEDFSRAFAGVAKARATWTWDGQIKRLFITVAGPNGAEIKPDSDTYFNFLAALQKAGDPFVSLRVKSYRPVYFRLAGKVKVNPDYETDLVLASAEQTLRNQFSFDVRAFGQPVFSSEVIAAVQSVPGVVAVDLSKLYRADAAATLETRLLAALPEMLADGSMVAAELLMLDPAPLNGLGMMP
jgi:predicted phage baseplate assembly protein